jgi:hypothetical protein
MLRVSASAFAVLTFMVSILSYVHAQPVATAAVEAQTRAFIELVRSDAANAAVARDFHTLISNSNAPAALPGLRVLFVPGYAWKSDRSTGADFARQRELLARLGLEHELVHTDERGSVEDNAHLVLQAIRAQPASARLLLVSASKGGPEVALALHELSRLPAAEQQTVRGWVSVGGMLRGTPLADAACQWPLSWLVHLMLWAKGLDGRILHDMRPERRKAAVDQLRIPPHVLLLQYVGAPSAATVSPQARGNYERLAELGPNDGLTLLADQLLPGSLVVVDEGLDHYFRDPQIDIKTLALLQIVAVRVNPRLADGSGG